MAEPLPTADELREMVETEVALRLWVERLEGAKTGIRMALVSAIPECQWVNTDHISVNDDGHIVGHAVMHMRGGRSKRVFWGAR
jgi:hypothetical protein